MRSCPDNLSYFTPPSGRTHLIRRFEWTYWKTAWYKIVNSLCVVITDSCYVCLLTRWVDLYYCCCLLKTSVFWRTAASSNQARWLSFFLQLGNVHQPANAVWSERLRFAAQRTVYLPASRWHWLNRSSSCEPRDDGAGWTQQHRKCETRFWDYCPDESS